MRLVTAIIGIGLAAASLRAEPKPLAEAAESMAGKLGAGCIVTGESIDGKVAFALAGKGLDALPPEKHVFEIGSLADGA